MKKQNIEYKFCLRNNLQDAVHNGIKRINILPFSSEIYFIVLILDFSEKSQLQETIIMTRSLKNKTSLLKEIKKYLSN